MSKREDEKYAEWLDDLKEQHPDIADTLDSLADTEAGRELFRGGLREADYYRRLNEIRDARAEIDRQGQEQVSWWEEAKPEYQRALRENEELKKRLEAGMPLGNENGNGGNGGNGLPPEFEALRQRVGAMDQGYPQLMSGMFQVQMAAMREGLEYDPDKVLQLAFEKHIRPIEAFNSVVAEQRQAKAKQMLEGELEKAREEGYKQALSKISSPDQVIRRQGPSIVDALSGKAEVLTDERARRDAAVSDYLEFQASEQG